MENIENECPFVSVIIPSYNAQDTIINALDSLNRQSFKDFEVVLINDGSTDETKFVIEDYINTHKLKIKYIEQLNMGVSQARNTGLSNAEGEYIAFLDSDDIYHVDFLREMIDSIVKFNCDTAYCSYTRDIDKVKINITNEVSINKMIHNHDSLMREFMFRNGPCGFFTFMYKKEIIQKNNLWFNKNFKYGEDLEFTWKYLSHCKNGVFINKTLYGYYDNPGSAMNNVNWRMTDAITAMNSVEIYLKENKDSFYNSYSNYMVSRTVWAICKDFSLSGKYELLKKIKNQYDIKTSMKEIIKESNNNLIKISASLYLLSPLLFFGVIYIFGKLNKLNR